MSTLAKAKNAALWPLRQFGAVPGRVYEQLAAVAWREYFVFVFVRPWINLLKLNRLMIFWTLGVGSPVQQIAGSAYLAIQLIVASATVLTFAAVVFVIPAMIGAARLLPAVDGFWQSVTGTGKGSYNDLNELEFWP